MPLASRIAPCYRCGYDTSAVESPRCAECGSLLTPEARDEFHSRRRRRAFVAMLPFMILFVVSVGIAGSPDRLMYALDPYLDRRLILVSGFAASTVLMTRLFWGLSHPRWLAVLPGLPLGIVAYLVSVFISDWLVGITWGHVTH